MKTQPRSWRSRRGARTYALAFVGSSSSIFQIRIFLPITLRSSVDTGRRYGGALFDQFGLPVVLAAVFLTALFSPLVFFGGFYLALIGMLLWGLGYATQDTLLKAVVAGVLPEGQRNLAFGLYYAGYGVGWLVGSVAAGLLYEKSHIALVLFAMMAQLAALPIFVIARRQ